MTELATAVAAVTAATPAAVPSAQLPHLILSQHHYPILHQRRHFVFFPGIFKVVSKLAIEVNVYRDSLNLLVLKNHPQTLSLTCEI